jgi:hypothetical protein
MVERYEIPAEKIGSKIMQFSGKERKWKGEKLSRNRSESAH